MTIVDAQPTSDPRWAEEGGRESSETGSLLLKHQLEEKIQKHAAFFAFLHDTQLWDGLDHPSRVALFSHSEKLHAAAALREHQNSVQTAVFTEKKEGEGKGARTLDTEGLLISTQHNIHIIHTLSTMHSCCNTTITPIYLYIIN